MAAKKTSKSAPREHRGGPTPRAGKPSTINMLVRATPEERERWQAAADAAGTTLSAVARAAWERLAKRTEG